MLDMLLRGYVTPEDFAGTDTERLQKAFDASHELNIGRVVLKGSYAVEKTILMQGMTDLVLDDATLCGTGDFPVLANANYAKNDSHSWSLQDRFFTIRGKGRFLGDVLLYNAFHVNIDGVEFGGALRFSFVSEVRLYNSRFTGNEGVVITMGSNNFIMQGLIAECKNSAVVMDATADEYDYVIGKEPEIHEIILQDSSFHTSASAVILRASLDAKVYNMQLDHLVSDGVTLEIGKAGETVPAECYFNLTGEHFTTDAKEAVVIHNSVKHCYFPSEK